MQLHPHINALLAAEHVKDMRAQASRARRARSARRARRGTGTVGVHAQTSATEPCFA